MSKFLLDEMYAPDLAKHLCGRGHDAVAIAGDPVFAGTPDERVLERAAREQRCLVTENTKDFRPLSDAWLLQNRPHAGIVFTDSKQFPRNRQFAYEIVRALLRDADAGRLPHPSAYTWLRRE